MATFAPVATWLARGLALLFALVMLVAWTAACIVLGDDAKRKDNE